jgi:hypothetical protein
MQRVRSEDCTIQEEHDSINWHSYYVLDERISVNGRFIPLFRLLLRYTALQYVIGNARRWKSPF